MVLFDEFYLVPWRSSDFRKLEFAKTIMEALQTLRRLKLSLIVSFKDLDTLRGFCDWLEAISGRNKLECIEIHLDVVLDYEPNNAWHRLEEVLIKSGWPELKSVSITVAFEDQPATLAFERALNLDTRFLHLRGSKQLDFQFSIQTSTASDDKPDW